jgi:hypothetical protein
MWAGGKPFASVTFVRAGAHTADDKTWSRIAVGTRADRDLAERDLADRD